MFRNLLKNRLFIGGFVFFLFSVVGGLLYLWHLERQTTENIQRDATRTKASSTAGKSQGPKTDSPVVEDAGPGKQDQVFQPPPGTTQENITSPKSENHNQFAGKLMHELTPKERAKIWEQAYRENVGGKPPRGYLKAAEQEFQDRLKSLDEPKVHVSRVRGFAPNREQLDRYLELRERFREAHARGNQTEADFFQAEMGRLEVEAEGDVPSVRVSWQGEKARSKASQVLDEAIKQAYRDFGLEHLLEHGLIGPTPIRPTIPE